MLFLMRTVKFSAAASRAGLYRRIKQTQTRFNNRRIDEKLLWLKFRMSINTKSMCEQQKCAFEKEQTTKK